MFSFIINQCLTLLVILFFFGCGSKKISIKNDNVFSKENNIEKINKIDDLIVDTDGDGVVNKFDLEQNTPTGTPVDDSGRSLDLDNDGVPDHFDDDPFSTFGGLVDENGRELDDDGDGIPNNKDLELDTKKGNCVNNKGESVSCQNAIFPIIYFKPNSSQVEDFNLDRLQVISTILRSNSNYKLHILGFFDFDGLESYNVQLDFKRAEAVSQILYNIFGIDRDRMLLHFDLQKKTDQTQNNFLRKVEFKVF